MTAASSVWVVGAGATGSFLAAHWAEQCATLVGRDGRRFSSPVSIEINDSASAGSVRARVEFRGWDDLPAFPAGAEIWLACKAGDLPAVVARVRERLPKNVGEAPVALILGQNGLGIWDEVRSLISDQPGIALMRASLRFGCVLERAGRVRTGAGRGSIEIAGDDRELAQRIALRRSTPGLEVVGRDERPEQVEWRKGLLNVALNGLCALAERPNGAVLEEPRLKKHFENLLIEAVAVAQARGVAVSEADIQSVWQTVKATSENKNSLWMDLAGGRPTEIRWLNRRVVEWGQRLGVPTLNHAWIADLIELRQEKG